MTSTIDPNMTIGVVSLTVSDLNRSLNYYQHNIGLKLQHREADTAMLGAGDRHLLRLQELPGARLVRRATGLFHFALLVPSRLELARTLQHLLATETTVGGASDHLVSEALYLSDPDGHGIEIYRDRPRSDWYDANGNFKMDTLRMDVPGVMGELEKNEVKPWTGIHPDTVMGHIHLQVADVPTARQFYTEVLGLSHMTDYPGATFLSAGGYHHHVGMNIWAGAAVPAPPADAARLLSYEMVLPDQDALQAVVDRVKAAGVVLTKQDGSWLVQDPSQNTIMLKAN
ncbi:MAG: VOC family protein [Anaerolineae bacterium]|nr:VOC family protein [Anaerolineae bacterium]